MNVAANIIGYQVKDEDQEKLEAFMHALDLRVEDRKLVREFLDAERVSKLIEFLDTSKLAEAKDYLVETLELSLLREAVRKKIDDVVRKKPGGGGFVLYSPNKGKKKPSKSVGEFPTKLAAKRAELARFPPKDTAKLKRLRDQIAKLSKDPKKRHDAEERALHTKEGLETVKDIVLEALFREETEGSQWDDRIEKLSKAAVETDSKFQSLQKNIQKKTESVLSSAVSDITKALKKHAKVKSAGVKKDLERKKVYLQFSLVTEKDEVGPFYLFIEGSSPKIEISDEARQALSRLESDKSKLIRAELITVQEEKLDKLTELSSAIESRDKYLDKLESKLDGFVSSLNGMEVSILKNLLIMKYRGK